MHRHHPHVARANDIPGVANNEGPFHGVAADASAVLERLRVAKGDDAGDAVFDVLWDGFDSAVGEGGALAVFVSVRCFPFFFFFWT